MLFLSYTIADQSTILHTHFDLVSSVLSSHHIINHAGIALDAPNRLGGYVFLSVIRNKNAVIGAEIHLHGGIHFLQQAMRINARQHKAALIQRFGADCGSADAHRWNRRFLGRIKVALLVAPLSGTTQKAFICKQL